MHKITLDVRVETLKVPATNALLIRGELPFVPTVGMVLTIVHMERPISLLVEDIQWWKSVGKEGFHVVSLSDTYKNYTRQQIRDGYKADGWIVDVD